MRLLALVAAAALWACASTAANVPAPNAAPPAGSATALLELQGPWRQGSLVFGRAQPGSTVSFKGRLVRVADDGRFVIGLDRDEAAEVQLVVAHDGTATDRRTFKVEPRQYDIQRIDGLPPAQVTPPPEALKRIERDYAQVRAARGRDSTRGDVFAGFTWPAVGRISGVYGSQRILNGVPKQPHFGVDVAAPIGTPVRAPAGGTVTLAVPDMYYTGGTIMIDHGYGVSSAFLHLSRLHVKEGQEVKQGDPIGEIGMTGRASGPHLDWRVNWFEARVDAQQLVGPMPGKPEEK